MKNNQNHITSKRKNVEDPITRHVYNVAAVKLRAICDSQP